MKKIKILSSILITQTVFLPNGDCSEIISQCGKQVMSFNNTLQKCGFFRQQQ